LLDDPLLETTRRGRGSSDPEDPAGGQPPVRAKEVKETGVHTPKDPVSDETSLWLGVSLLMRET